MQNNTQANKNLLSKVGITVGSDGKLSLDESKVKTANAQSGIMEVFEGNRVVVPFTGQTGYKYEILYSALDFEGNTSNKKYYIQF